MDDQVVVILLNPVLQATVADTAHMERKDSSRPRKRRKKTSKRQNNRFAS
jgi:hypothetical protein